LEVGAALECDPILKERGCREWYILELSFTPVKKGKEEVIDSQAKEATSLE